MDLVCISIYVEAESFDALLKTKGYQVIGECSHPTWNGNFRGVIYSRPQQDCLTNPTNPVFIFVRRAIGGDIVFIWLSTSSSPSYSVMIGWETLPIPQECADGAVDCLKEVLGEEHIKIYYHSSSYENIEDVWKDKEEWVKLWRGKIMEIQIF